MYYAGRKNIFPVSPWYTDVQPASALSGPKTHSVQSALRLEPKGVPFSAGQKGDGKSHTAKGPEDGLGLWRAHDPGTCSFSRQLRNPLVLSLWPTETGYRELWRNLHGSETAGF